MTTMWCAAWYDVYQVKLNDRLLVAVGKLGLSPMAVLCNMPDTDQLCGPSSSHHGWLHGAE